MILYNNSYKTMILKLLQRNNINRYSKYNPYWCVSGNPKKKTMQTSNLTIGHERQNNFGKAVLAIASVKAKEVHGFLNFYFGMHHICFYSMPPLYFFKILI